MDNLKFKNAYNVYKQKKTNIINTIDNKIRDFLKDFDYETFQVPSLISKDTLNKCGYFSSFPHHITVAASFHSDSYENIINENNIKKEYLDDNLMYLTPAACLHVYPTLENDNNITEKIITSKVRVFRHEANFDGLTRLWDFVVREIVFIGNETYVKKKLDYFKNKSLKFAREISKSAKINEASDNFYPTVKNKVKKRLQKANHFKSELIITINNSEVALSSFNYHHTHFSQAFNFDQNCKIVTGCVGFGLERWLAACMEYDCKVEE